LDYHLKQGIEWCKDDARFNAWWGEIAEWIDPVTLGHPLLDIGCGPRPPFAGTVIEPLAKEYSRLVPPAWWSAVTPCPVPAETLVPLFDRYFRMVLCWNCLDHTYDWRAILDNVVRYLAPGGRFALATDFREPSIGHPGYPRVEFLTEIQERFEVVKTREHFKERDLCMVLKAR
jgi:SAM-dependent methyltransferase